MVPQVVAYTIQADKVLLEQADERDQRRLGKTTADRTYVVNRRPGSLALEITFTDYFL